MKRPNKMHPIQAVQEIECNHFAYKAFWFFEQINGEMRITIDVR